MPLAVAAQTVSCIRAVGCDVIRRNLALGLWGLEITAGVSHEGAL
jgi:hypothetical protein